MELFNHPHVKTLKDNQLYSTMILNVPSINAHECYM